MSGLRIDASSVNSRMRVTCERCLRRYDVPDATVKGRKIRARCKCGARVVVQDEERAAKSVAPDSNTTGAIQRPVRWFVDITSWEPIAMDLRQLVRAFDAGRIDADTLVWRKGMPDWRRLRDVVELAERLIGAEGTPANGESAPPAEVRPRGSEPPPQQHPERSRTPPASYTVGAKRGPEHQADPAATSNGDSERPTVPPPEEVAGTLPGVSKAPAGHGVTGSGSPALSALGNPRARKSNRTGTPVSPRASFSPKQSRTITQTGLALPPSAGARTSGAAGASSSTTPDSNAEKSGHSSGAVPSSGRNSRNPTPGAGPRRVPSNDETPAQKPSSISVPPDAITPTSPGLRGKRLVAIAAVVFGLALGLQQWLEEAPADAGGAASSVQAENPSDSSQIEKRKALEPEPARAPVPHSPETNPPSTAEASVTSAPEVGPAGGQPSPALAQPTAAQQPKTLAPRPSVRAPIRPATRRESSRSNGDPQSDGASVVRPAAIEPSPTSPAAGAVQAPPSGISEPAAAGRDSSLVLSDATETTPLAHASGSEAGSAAAPSVPRSFDTQAAQQHLGIAAFKASTCSELGPTRGAGQVKVLIETWGRVVRVTHLNQAFVGTPVGLCIMEAFQQVQVPPFDGAAQSVTGSFVIE